MEEDYRLGHFNICGGNAVRHIWGKYKVLAQKGLTRVPVAIYTTGIVEWGGMKSTG